MKHNDDLPIHTVLNRNVGLAADIRAATRELSMTHVVLAAAYTPKTGDPDAKASVERLATIELMLGKALVALENSNEMLKNIALRLP